MAFFDPLTNLPNRRSLLDRLLQAEHRAIATGRKLGVVYLDLDGFKGINDTLGHEGGDNLLREVSTAMTRSLGPGDFLARVGGDEFVILVEDLRDRGELAVVAQRLSAAVEGETILGRITRQVRASCGTAVFPDDGDRAHDVMREADSAMYHAKRRQRVATPRAVAS